MELRRWHLASLWIIPGVLICVNLSWRWERVRVCTREAERDKELPERSAEHWIYWLAVRLTHLRVSEWMSGLWKSFLSPGAVFLLFPEKWVCFVFVEINASFFSFYKRQWKTCFFFSCQGSWDFLNSAVLLKMIIFLLCIQSCACCITAVRVVTVCRCVMNMPTVVRHEENTFISHTLPLGLLCEAAIFLCYKTVTASVCVEVSDRAASPVNSVWLTVQEKVITHSCFALKHNYMYIWAHRQWFPASEYRSFAAYGGAFCINMCTVSRLSGRFFSLWMLNTFLIRMLGPVFAQNRLL